jgi:DNA-directed RNA polymerase beta' subunit
MAHFVRVLTGRTFRLHPAAAFPYNADLMVMKLIFTLQNRRS